ncbi:MAG: ribbon-helix-helix domain-containing protein, partial [Cyanobacteria bacterium J06629_2]
RTTITIPNNLVEKVDMLIEQHDLPSRNQFIIEALELKVREMENREIDREFALMASDAEYQSETLQLEQEFVHTDREIVA